jgi:hypothetical protein
LLGSSDKMMLITFARSAADPEDTLEDVVYF